MASVRPTAAFICTLVLSRWRPRRAAADPGLRCSTPIAPSAERIDRRNHGRGRCRFRGAASASRAADCSAAVSSDQRETPAGSAGGNEPGTQPSRTVARAHQSEPCRPQRLRARQLSIRTKLVSTATSCQGTVREPHERGLRGAGLNCIARVSGGGSVEVPADRRKRSWRAATGPPQSPRRTRADRRVEESSDLLRRRRAPRRCPRAVCRSSTSIRAARLRSPQIRRFPRQRSGARRPPPHHVRLQAP